MKKLCLFFSLIFPLLLFSQKEDDFIHWSENRKLSWDDFKAPPVRSGSTAALTATHLGFSYNMVNGKITFTIECRFDKNKSWGLVKNDWILQHEQGHFDIAEIFARRLHKSITGYTFNRNSFQKDLDGLYSRIVEEKEKYQQQYDDETDYSRNKTKQEEWLKKIAAGLAEYKSWAGYH